MSRKSTDPHVFLPGSTIQALVQDQSAADEVRAKIEGDEVLREAVHGFAAEGSLPPYMPESGQKVVAELVVPAPAVEGAVPSSRRPEVVPSVVIAPQASVLRVAPLPAASASGGDEQVAKGPADVAWVELAPALPHRTTNRLERPPGAEAFLEACASPQGDAVATDSALVEQPKPMADEPRLLSEETVRKRPPEDVAPAPAQRRWIALAVAAAIVLLGYLVLSGLFGTASNGAATASGAPTVTPSVTQANPMPTPTAAPSHTVEAPLPLTADVSSTTAPPTPPSAVATIEPIRSSEAPTPIPVASARPKASSAPSVPVTSSSASPGSSAWKPNW